MQCQWLQSESSSTIDTLDIDVIWFEEAECEAQGWVKSNNINILSVYFVHLCQAHQSGLVFVGLYRSASITPQVSPKSREKQLCTTACLWHWFFCHSLKIKCFVCFWRETIYKLLWKHMSCLKTELLIQCSLVFFPPCHLTNRHHDNFWLPWEMKFITPNQ